MTSIEDIEIDVSQIDFSDLDEQFAVETSAGYDHYVVVDGAPVAPESKAPVLVKVLSKLFNTVGTVSNVEMPIEDGKTKGFLFVEFSSAAEAEEAIKKLNGKKLDQKHRLFVNRLSDIEKYSADKVSDEFVSPLVPEFEETDYLRSWLQDYQGRDQFILQKGDIVGAFWNKKKEQPEPVVEPRTQWTNSFVRFSPKGSYLFSLHPQGVQAWGGPEFSRMKRFPQFQARLIDFSPCEKFLVTLSPEPISVPPENHPRRSACPFGAESEGHKLVIWEIATGLPARTFRLPDHLEKEKKMPWPLVKWSHDDKYAARLGPDALAIYETETFGLLDKKTIKIDGIVDFEWSPAPVHLAKTANSAGEHVLAYWTPESTNQTARVSLMQVPSKEVLRTSNLFHVSECRLHWQDEGKFLCVKVDRHTKSKKTLFSNLEFFSLTEKDIPVEKMELKEKINNFAWEPKSDRFAIISRLDNGNLNPAVPKNTISFYAPEIESKGKIAALRKWKAFKTIENKHSNMLSWSPKGRFIATGTVPEQGHAGEIDFFDMDYEEANKEKNDVNANFKQIGHQEFFGLSDISWDPSGRFVAGWSSLWHHKIENGYKIFSFAGQLTREELIEEFKDFRWRPRPASLLSAADRKKVRKSLKAYSLEFEETDAMEADAATREIILARHALLDEWKAWRAEVEVQKAQWAIVGEDEVKPIVIEEIREEILEQKEELVV
ncbi:hypothetical protein BABINDRAFT_178753 [Babjeviella inositovora NRRL Y-12698]|uniref:Eukaryotic translation initiation factor 3 subunit B n=1 Tax=Babjeviella inositovora NRRL Y-12698 TaxID=984486 RepID=A0A1E3QXW0_9ASCO|nr:uncharacterized protein BABINDRAFT_178753 [Babjeviella inositovora NRRL Y-12698]ODQ82518.1 hypothetical protein BABINDRAFT_178753 [Babjeviella inositovora NRRL Y-12698]